MSHTSRLPGSPTRFSPSSTLGLDGFAQSLNVSPCTHICCQATNRISKILLWPVILRVFRGLFEPGYWSLFGRCDSARASYYHHYRGRGISLSNLQPSEDLPESLHFRFPSSWDALCSTSRHSRSVQSECDNLTTQFTTIATFDHPGIRTIHDSN